MPEMSTVAETGEPDPFATTFGDGRGEGAAGLREREIEEHATARQRQRVILAIAGAHGILGHNTAVSMPDAFSKGRIAAFIEHGGKSDRPERSEVSEELVADIKVLVSQGFLRYHSAAHEFGHDTDRDRYSISPAGLIELWTGIK